ncbi:phosphoglucosamine mutase [Kiritimatiella glycovorans]|uniref:Phosphoglucosamine mutase n=1 Tax=Kiritimatiella glycovorans TaxID=1307763 RepID=A0A0G3EBZ4_9BACT|nr:phosphoglucosamine mutase [Kiritimatiella glycovorans]AKJ64006.1 Phosphoglucosamine mutase [Kiritimatiella glycovorans]
MDKLFGTDGVRGLANSGPMSAEMIMAIARATAHVCKRHHRQEEMRPKIVIGKDTRLSGYMLESALTAGICSMGVDVLLVGPIPTPGLAYITHSMRADAGIVISASHNPFHDNGIKIFSRSGTKLPDDEEREIEELVRADNLSAMGAAPEEIGKARRIEDSKGRYIEFCKRSFPDACDLDGIKLVLDCANGATYQCAPVIFSELGAEVETIFNRPDGMNINEACGSQYPETLIEKVRAGGADAGLAFDGDGDRLIAVDEHGRVLTGDHLLAICAKAWKGEGRLANDTVVGTQMTNFGFMTAMQDLGVNVERAKVGDRYVLERMKQRGAVLGGESSGHLIFSDIHTTGDGIVSALQVLAIMRTSGKPLSELADVMKLAPQRLINIDVAEKKSIDDVPPLREAVSAAETELGDRGRVLIRYSGTQPLCRVMVEGPDEATTTRLAESLSAVVREHLGA